MPATCNETLSIKQCSALKIPRPSFTRAFLISSAATTIPNENCLFRKSRLLEHGCTSLWKIIPTNYPPRNNGRRRIVGKQGHCPLSELNPFNVAIVKTLLLRRVAKLAFYITLHAREYHRHLLHRIVVAIPE